MASGFLLFGLLAAICFATANVLDKLLMMDHVDRPTVKAFFYGISAPFVAVPALAMGGFRFPGIRVLSVGLAAGILFFTGFVVIMRAMQLDEVSRLALLKQITPVFVVLLSFLLLGEVLSSVQYVGIGVLILAGLLSTLKHPEKGLPDLELNKPFFLVVVSNVFAAASFVCLRYLVGFTDFWTALYWQQAGVFCAAVLTGLMGRRYHGEIKSIMLGRPKSLGLILASSVAMVAGNLSLVAGFSRISASIIASINTINPLFTLLYVVALQRLGFKQFEEDLSRTELAVKILAVLLFVSGIYLVR